MNQAIHIFLKDLRALWFQVATLMLVIGVYAAMDISITQTNLGTALYTVAVQAAVWLLIARAVHQESLPGENQFWLTRPYERSSLIISKFLMALCIVVVPFFLADCIILLAQSLPLMANLGGLVLRQIVVAGWLILPPLAIATVTRSIAEDVMVWIVLIAILSSKDVGSLGERYHLVLLAEALMLAAACRQYFTRTTTSSRAWIAIAVLLPMLPFPVPAALALEVPQNDPAASHISLAANSANIPEAIAAGAPDVHCVPRAFSIEGVRPGWRIARLGQEDTFSADGKTRSMGWRSAGPQPTELYFLNGVALISECLSASGLRDLGAGPYAVHTSLALAVYAEDPPIRVKATLNPFRVPGLGTCQIQGASPAVTSRRGYELACKSPVWFPRQGSVTVGSERSRNLMTAASPYAWAPMNLLPGLSPVYKWVALWFGEQLPAAIANGGEIEFKTERRIAVLRRELTVKEVRFVQE